MVTTRGSRFLMFCGAFLALALVGPLLEERLLSDDTAYFLNPVPVALVALTLLLWFSFEWLLFTVRAQLIVRQLQIERLIQDNRGPVETLWAGTTVIVRIRVQAPDGIGIPYVTLRDRLPFAAEQVGGDTRFEGSISAQAPAEWTYRIRVPGIGRIRFEGLVLQMADLQGFFYYTTFLPCVRKYRVLPAVHEAGSHSGTLKRQNLLLPPGVHRHRRPGTGSELLDLRDYRPGDPPKTIAWKVSARRDRLMTKEYENEVPVRCTLFIDASRSVRIGAPGQNALARLAEVAASVARTASENRDLIGVCRFDENGCDIVRPGRGNRHLIRLLNLCAETAGQPPAASVTPASELLPLAYAFAHEVYPEQMRSEINRFPFWLSWLWPPPPYTVHRPRLADRLYRWLPFLLPVYALAAIGLLALVTYALLFGLVEADAPGGAFLIFLLLPVVVILIALLRIPTMLFFPERRRRLQWRKQLAALLSVKYGLAPGGLAILLEDDVRLGFYLQRFLSDHHVPYPPPLYDRKGRYLFSAPTKINVLASALLRAVSKSHDNELFVLLVDVLELTDELAPLLRAVKVALARHHRVLLICPWPPGIPRALPTDEDSNVVADYPNMEDPELLRELTARRFQRAYRRLRRTFMRLGVPVVSAAAGDPARVVLDRLEMLRDLGTKR